MALGLWRRQQAACVHWLPVLTNDSDGVPVRALSREEITGFKYFVSGL